jgi:hypothetical protein
LLAIIARAEKEQAGSFQGGDMVRRQEDWVRCVIMPGVGGGAAIGVALSGLFMWIFPEAFRYWQDYVLFPVLNGTIGAIVAWTLTVGAGVIRYLRNR